ncbi:MAG TPA: GAF domain-containing protein [Leptolyngbyaceae cyanobacterium]
MTAHYEPKQTEQQNNGNGATFDRNLGNGNSPIRIIASGLNSIKSDIQRTPLWDKTEISEKFLRLEKLVVTAEQKFKSSWDASLQGQFKSEREKLFAISTAIRQATDLERKLKIAVSEIRKVLRCDRVLVYRFNGESFGVVVAESVERELTPALNQNLSSSCFGANTAADYLAEKIVAIDDISAHEITLPQVQLLQNLQVKATLSVPLIVGEQVWGLLVVQQCNAPRNWLETEINLTYQISTELAVFLQPFELRQQVQRQVEQEQTFNKVISRIRQSQELETLFKSTSREVRQLLNADRVAVFRLFPESGFNEGIFISEDVLPSYSSTVGLKVYDHYFGERFAHQYREGRIQAVADIHNAGMSECHVELLAQFQIRANLIVPLINGEDLWGLLCIHQCNGPREWQSYEIDFVKKIAGQFGIALGQARYLEELKEKSNQLALVAEREKNFIQIIGKVGQSIADKIQHSLDIDTIFKTTTQQVRRLLNVDRITVYRFNPDWSGNFVAESVASGWTQLLNQQSVDNHFVDDIVDYGNLLRKSGTNFRVADTYLLPTRGGRRHERHNFIVDDVSQAGFPECYLELLEQFEAKAYVLVPIIAGEKLWGLLGAYQNTGARHWEDSEINLLTQIATQLGVALRQSEYLAQLQAKTEKLAEVAQRQETLTKVIDKIRQTLDVNNIFKTTTQEMRQLLNCERVAVYQFQPDWSGIFVAESVASGWPKWVGPDMTTVWEDSYLQETQGGRYRKNEKFSVDNVHSKADDINNAGLSRCHVEILEQYQIKAYIIVPIFVGDALWGLLAAYEHSTTRSWEEPEVNLLAQVGIQMGVALRQAKYVEQVKNQSEQLAEAAQREKTAKEQLQQQAIQLLSAIQPTLKGDLTVRVPITTNEVGTIADAYNNIIQSLRKILVQVQSASAKVAQTSQVSGTSIQSLSEEAQHQFHELTEALKQVQGMLNSTQAVATNAAQVEIAVQKANQIVQKGDLAMNRTVNEIVAIRETVAKTGKKIKRLSESSQKISKAVNLIGNLATQTNLLALNAAIEATRAGEYGKGFAVVADEVRSLARQSAAATTEIEQLVQEIQAETGEVVSEMETGIQQVVEGTQHVNETRQNLNAIVSATAEIQELVESITQATLLQTKQSEAVTEVMNNVAVVANKTSEDSLQISASFKELLAMAEELQNSVGKFKLN